MSEPSQRRNVALLATLGAGGVALLVLAAELWILPAFLEAPRDTWLMGFAATEDRVDDVAINPLGFTGDALAPEKAPGTLRVLTLGGSAFFNRRMTERLKDRLGATTPRAVEVLGAALRAHNSAASVRKYRFLRHYGFDLVLVYHGINDLKANHVAPEDFRTDYSHLDPWYRDHALLRRSVIARVLYNRLHREPPLVWSGAGFASAEAFRSHLATLVGEIRRDGGTPVLLTFAWSIPDHYSFEGFRAGIVGYHNPEGYDPVPVELWGPIHHVRGGLMRHNVVVHQLAAEGGVALVDMERRIGRDLRHFGDVCHLSEAGTELFVTLLVEELAAKGLLDPPGS